VSRAKAAAAPSASFDVPASGRYAPGATMTLTVTRTPGVASTTVSIPGFADTVATAPVDVPVTVKANDGRTYTLASDDGTTAKYTATA
jgi:hypothetical protein